MPQVKGAPKELNKLLERVYQQCMLKRHDKTKCSKIAWGAAKNAGWYKDKEGNWKKRKKEAEHDMEEYELFTCDLENDGICEWVSQEGSNEYASESDGGSKSAVMVIGDRFMKGAFLSAKELAKTKNMWNSTIHDINHMATTYPMGLMLKSNIEYVIGYQKNTRWDAANNRMATDIVLNEHAPKYAAWKSYIDICAESGRVPNVSVSFYGKRKQVKASDLPKGTNYAVQGYAADDLVDCIYDIHPVALSTVLMGACSDKDGCGIKGCSVDQSSLDNGESGADSDGCTEIPAKELKGPEAVKADEERIKYFQRRIKELKWRK